MSDPARIRSITPPERDRPAGIAEPSAQDVRLEPGRRWLNWRVVGALAVLVVVAAVLLPGLLDWVRASAAIERERLRFATVEHGTFDREIAVQASVVAAASTSVYSTDAGIVRLDVRAGDTVRRDDVLGVIASPELASELLQEQARLDGLQASLRRQSIDNRRAQLANQQALDLARLDLEAAERELRRAEQSWEFRVISRQDFEKAVDDLDKARVDFHHAEETAALNAEGLDFELASLELERDRQRLIVDNLTRRVEALTLRSPVDGIVGDVAIEQRSAVAANTPIVTVVDLTALEVEARVAEAYADDLAPGMPVKMSFGDVDYDGIVHSVSPEIENNRVSTRIRFSAGTPPNLRRNQRLTARILLESRDGVLKVRRGNFFDTGGGRLAYRLNGDLLERVAITTGSVSAREVEILSGLDAGDTITISNIEQFDGEDTVLLTDG